MVKYTAKGMNTVRQSYEYFSSMGSDPIEPGIRLWSKVE